MSSAPAAVGDDEADAKKSGNDGNFLPEEHKCLYDPLWAEE